MKLTSRTFIWIYILFFNLCVFAQPGDENDTGDLEGDDPPPSSIDKYLIILFIVSIIYMFYVFYNNKKEVRN